MSNQLFKKFPAAIAFVESLNRQKSFINTKESKGQIWNAVTDAVTSQIEVFGYDKANEFHSNVIENCNQVWYK